MVSLSENHQKCLLHFLHIAYQWIIILFTGFWSGKKWIWPVIIKPRICIFITFIFYRFLNLKKKLPRTQSHTPDTNFIWPNISKINRLFLSQLTSILTWHFRPNQLFRPVSIMWYIGSFWLIYLVYTIWPIKLIIQFSRFLPSDQLSLVCYQCVFLYMSFKIHIVRF